MGPPSTGGFYAHVLTADAGLAQWYYVGATADTAQLALELPPRQSVTIRVMSVDGRTPSAMRLLATGLTAMTLISGDTGRPALRIAVTPTTLRITEAPDSVAAFAYVPLTWEIEDPSHTVSAPIWMDAGILLCPSPFLGNGLGGGGCDTARGGPPVELGNGRYRFSVTLTGRPSTTLYWQAILVAHPLSVNGGRQVGFFAPVMTSPGGSARLIVGTGSR